MNSCSRSKKSLLTIGGAFIWLVALATGFVVLMEYGATPGKAEAAPQSIESKNQPLIMMFVHPRCPCTQASLDELASIRTQSKASIKIIISGPSLVDADDDIESLNHRASLEGWSVEEDHSGEMALKYGAHTSGHTVAYDAHGELSYSGGVTLFRGHRGTNPGIQALAQIVKGEDANQKSGPVYGCPIFNTNKENYQVTGNVEQDKDVKGDSVPCSSCIDLNQ